ncbi:hypothetical protein [Streptomyces nojiriensis]
MEEGINYYVPATALAIAVLAWSTGGPIHGAGHGPGRAYAPG